MADGKDAATAAGSEDVIAMALDELRGSPQPAEAPEQSNDEETDLSQTDEETSEEGEKDEAEEEGEKPDDEAEDEKPDEDEAHDVPREKIQKRIDKLTAQKKEAAERAQALEVETSTLKAKVQEFEAKVAELSRPVLSPTPDSPLADVDTPEALEAKISAAQEVRRWALRNTDGATVKRPDGNEVFLDADQVKDYLLKADDLITLHAPAKKQWLEQRQPALQAAKNLFPDMFKAGTQLQAAYEATVKQAPELLKLPQHEYWIGLALYGEQMLVQKQQAEAAKAKAQKKVSTSDEGKVPSPAKPISSSKSPTGSSVRKDVRERVMSGTGNLSDLEELVSGRLFSS